MAKTMTRPGGMVTMRVDRTVASLRRIFIPHAASDAVSNELDRLLRQQFASEALGRVDEAGGLVVIGPSGSGKTTAIKHAIEQHKLLIATQEDRTRPAVFVRVPAPASIKDLGAATLNALGWTVQVPSRWSAMERWRRVQNLLHDFRVRVLHFHEAQHLTTGKQKEMQATNDALKSRLQDPTWPVVLAISATPEFQSILSQDTQLLRRVVPLKIERMSLASDRDEIRDALQVYVQAARISPSDSIKSHDFCRRLMIAGDRLFALTCRMIVDGIEEALLEGAEELRIDHFANAFRRRTGAMDAYNAFVADDYRKLDIYSILDQQSEEDRQ
ncbi:MAG: TniB family NTP-binding protein [Pseudomonadota bacterium]